MLAHGRQPPVFQSSSQCIPAKTGGFSRESAPASEDTARMTKKKPTTLTAISWWAPGSCWQARHRRRPTRRAASNLMMSIYRRRLDRDDRELRPTAASRSHGSAELAADDQQHRRLGSENPAVAPPVTAMSAGSPARWKCRRTVSRHPEPARPADLRHLQSYDFVNGWHVTNLVVDGLVWTYDAETGQMLHQTAEDHAPISRSARRPGPISAA